MLEVAGSNPAISTKSASFEPLGFSRAALFLFMPANILHPGWCYFYSVLGRRSEAPKDRGDFVLFGLHLTVQMGV